MMQRMYYSQSVILYGVSSRYSVVFLFMNLIILVPDYSMLKSHQIKNFSFFFRCFRSRITLSNWLAAVHLLLFEV
jgi:hypothetical protein